MIVQNPMNGVKIVRRGTMWSGFIIVVWSLSCQCHLCHNVYVQDVHRSPSAPLQPQTPPQPVSMVLTLPTLPHAGHSSLHRPHVFFFYACISLNSCYSIPVYRLRALAVQIWSCCYRTDCCRQSGNNISFAARGYPTSTSLRQAAGETFILGNSLSHCINSLTVIFIPQCV